MEVMFVVRIFCDQSFVDRRLINIAVLVFCCRFSLDCPVPFRSHSFARVKYVGRFGEVSLVTWSPCTLMCLR